MTTLEHSVILVRGSAGRWSTWTRSPVAAAPTRSCGRAIARLLAEVADAVRTFGETLAASVPGPRPTRRLLRALARARAARDDLAKAMAAGPREEPGAWQVHGHLLANVDRLLSELDPEGQTWPGGGPA